MPTEFYESNPGRNQKQVDARGRRLASDASYYGKGVEVTVPGDVNVDPRMMLSLHGTGTAWDKSYLIKSVTHVFEQPEGASSYGGYTMTIEADDVPIVADSNDSGNQESGP